MGTARPRLLLLGGKLLLSGGRLTTEQQGGVSKGKPWPDCPKDKSKLGCPHHLKNCSSTGYTSLLPAGDDAVVVYDGPPGIFAMRVSLADEDVQW